MDRIGNSVRRVAGWHHEALPTNSDPRDRISYLIHKGMLDSFSCILLGLSALINLFFTFKYPTFRSAILIKTDVILTFL